MPRRPPHGGRPCRSPALRHCALALALLAAMPAAAAGSATRAAAPDDPLFRHQWNLKAIQIPAAWAISRGAGAVVAVLDTGVAFEDRGPYRRAPDLARTRFARGWDFVGDDPHPNDVAPAAERRSHGTQMAGLIAQTTDNALGSAGVAPDATIMPIRVLRPDLSGAPGDIARGLRFAADHGADVANLSISGQLRSRALARAVRYALAKGVTVVAAVGNDGGATISRLAALPGVIAVGAVGRDLRRAPYSSFGAALDLVAPAGAGDRLDTGYGPGDGVVAQTLKGGPATFCFCFTASTSAAAAQVSAVAALLVAAGRATTPAQVAAALRAGARDLGPRGRDDEYGAGLVQARDALTGKRDAARSTPADADAEPASGSSADGDGRTAWWWLLPVAAAAAAAAAVVAVRRRAHRDRA